jgi:hypothetical protein
MIITNFSTSAYYQGQDRLIASLNGYKTLMLRSYEPGWKTHRESPYEFKINAIEKAFEQDDIVLWCDASMYLVGDLSKIEKIIIEHGFFGEEAGHYVNDWCNQHTRQYFNLLPEENYTMFSAGLLGLNSKSEKAMTFFSEWKAAAKAGCFKGDYKDHRHDQTSASIIATRLGLKYQRGGEHMSYIGDGYGKPEEGSVFWLQGIA